MEDKCIMCNEDIPEGRQVCLICEYEIGNICEICGNKDKNICLTCRYWKIRPYNSSDFKASNSKKRKFITYIREFVKRKIKHKNN